MIIDEAVQKDFLVSEYKETHKYLINVEKSMLDLLRFYNSVFAIVVPISGLFLKFLGRTHAFPFLATLAFIVSLLGLYILAMYIELRVRKIKTLEQIAVFRERFIETNSIFSQYLKMITAIKYCPPYLRRPSSEWYTVIYMSFLNGVGISSIITFLLLWLLDTSFCLNFLGGLKIPLVIVLPVLSFLLIVRGLFLWATRYCYIYDLKREREYNTKNQYLFLDPRPYFPMVFKLFKWLAEREEGVTRSRYGPQDTNDSKLKNLQGNCDFCKYFQNKQGILFENTHFFCKWDNYPVSQGHMLIISKKHVTSFFALSSEEILSLYHSIAKGKEIIEKKYTPNGYNLGINIGKEAGQTILHLHIHLIPRYRGDVEDPEGGVRNIIPGKGKYGKNNGHLE
jgi:diadenosine tetraphosphate (Ap4A) HIT family hydrolase